jgi:hypothetical protein
MAASGLGASMSNADQESLRTENLRTVYRELCTSYRAIDDFRGKLLGFLPLASGTGIFLLIHNSSGQDVPQAALLPIGLLGLLVTIGLFIFEIYGIRRCTHLIVFGGWLEKQMHVEGQFTHRPLGLRAWDKPPAGMSQFVSEPLASGIIYSAVIGAWTFLACLEPGKALQDQLGTWIVSFAVFVAAFSISQLFNYWLHNTDVEHKRAQLELIGSRIPKE